MTTELDCKIKEIELLRKVVRELRKQLYDAKESTQPPEDWNLETMKILNRAWEAAHAEH